MRHTTALFLLLPLMFAAQAKAQGDADTGKSLFASCMACHGAQAEGNAALNAPRLSHLEPTYIAAQLGKFKNGQRGGDGASDSARQMAPMAAILADDQAVQDVSAFIGTLAGSQSVATVQGDGATGGDYYNQFCGACHGAGATGNPALNSPRLAGSDDWYIVGQLQAFRDGSRGSHPDDRSGRQMRAMAGTLPDEQALNDIAAYLHSLGG